MNNIFKLNYFLSYIKSKIFPLYIIISIIIIIKSEESNINKYIKKNTDIFLILTKDGYLHAFEKNEIREKWKIYFGNLIPQNIHIHKLAEDIYIYPINDKLFIVKENNLISFDIFVKEIVSNNSIFKNNYIIEGKIVNLIYMIDGKTGKILEKKNNINNITLIRNNLKDDNIILKIVNYFLIKKDKNKNENIFNISYSNINIEGKNNKNSFLVESDMNDIHNLINNLNITIEMSKIITIHSYCYNRNEIALIYNKDYLEKYINSFIGNNNKVNINQLDNYKRYFEEDINENMINKYDDLIDKLNYNNILSNFLHFFISIILIIIAIKYLPRLFIINVNNTNVLNENYNYNPSDNLMSIKDENNKKNNEVKNNVNNNTKICHHINNFSITSKSETINKKNEKKILKLNNNSISLNNGENKCTDLSLVNIPRCHSACKLSSCGEEMRNELFYSPQEDIELEEEEQEDNDYNITNHKFKQGQSDVIKNILKNNCCCNKIGYLDEYMKLINNKFINEINEEKDNYILKVNLLNEYKIPKNEITKEFIAQCQYLNSNKNSNLLPDNNYEQKNKEGTEDSLIKKSTKDNSDLSKVSSENVGGIWDIDDEDIDEGSNNNSKIDDFEEKSKNITINYNNTENISISQNSSNSNYINEKSNNKINKNIIDIKKETNTKSRLDKDFKNLEKIGEGGFGIVLKGIHRLDKGVCAIKIIKLSNLNDKNSIINEVTTMTSITSKHIVQYKTCWIDNVLGTASKFFYNDIDSETSSNKNLSNSVIIKKNDNNNSNSNSNNVIIDDEDDESDDNDLSIKNYNTDILSIKNKNDNSQEIIKINSKNVLTKYYCNYRDDSHIATKSILSNQYLNENRTESGTIIDGKYFFILMEYCDGLTLEKYISQNANKIIDRKKIYCFLSQILKSLVKIHSGGIIHRDIKPSNIFIKNDQLKIGDFGLATRYNKSCKLLKSKKIEGTPLYISPEQTNYKAYNEKVDIYACGITLYEMCACFSTSMERYENIMNLKNNQIINEKVNNNFPEESLLIQSMTKIDYNERPSAKEILNSNIFISLGKILGY